MVPDYGKSQHENHSHSKTRLPDQNRRQKVFNRGALRFCGVLRVCAEGLDTPKIDKISTDL